MRRTLPLLFLAVSCSTARGGDERPSPSAPTPPLRKIQVVVETHAGDIHGVRAEVAEDDDSRERGLMFRKSLADTEGMIFFFPDQAIHRFWMKNTLVPLDMVFIDEERAIVGIVADAQPMTLSSRSVERPSRYVLEVPGGWCHARGIAAGDRVRF